MSKVVKVMGFGTFDGIHEGHLDFFRQLKALGDKVYIVVARDSNVERMKCRPPKHKERERYEALSKIKFIDKVLLGHKDNFYQCIIDHKPDVIGLGYDQKADTQILKLKFPHIRVVRLKPYQPEKYKSSLLK
ncbi:adenylyltransferase/cytidyltransferase family protein [Candidatus Peregrinibacteria bacterium]|nr:adenylyltransferase/cytidyltransferase family protein [Candidatus Peregrinibacteria bacterium]